MPAIPWALIQRLAPFALIFALVTLVYVQGQRMHAAKVERDAAIEKLAGATSAIRAQTASIEALIAALDRKNAESLQRAADLRASQEEDQRNRVTADLAAAETDRRIAALQRYATSELSLCGVPDDLRKLLEGL